MTSNRTHRRAFNRLAAALLACAAGPCLAAEPAAHYPSKAVRIIVPYPPGAAADILARQFGQDLAEKFGQPFVVENRPGASGLPGNDYVAKSPADGYTILMAITYIVQAPALLPKVPYDVVKDLTPLARLALSSNLFISSNLQVDNMAQLVAKAKAAPGKYNYGSYGIGTSSNIHGEMLKRQAGIDLLHVPYKGGVQLINGLLGGQLDIGILDIGTARAYVNNGKFKVIAVSGEKRIKALPDVPTMTELGYKDFEPYGFFGMFMPAGTPKDIVKKLSDEIVRYGTTTEVNAKLEGMGVQPALLGTDEFTKVVEKDADTWMRTIKAAGITAE